jgi:multidrug efflux system outer membrane protein
MMTRLTPILAALALAGCAVGPDYVRPGGTLPDAYRESAADMQAAAIDQQWWRAFNDEELNALVTKALQDSTDIRIAIARVEQADAVARQAGATLFPEVFADASASRYRVSALAANAPAAGSPLIYNNSQLAASTSYELDFWGRLRRTRESALALAEASRYSRDTVRLTLAGSVVSTYINLRGNDAQIAAMRATLKTREEAYTIAKHRYELGSASRLDLEQADNSRATAAAQLSVLQQARALDANLHAQLIGVPNLVVGGSDGDLSKLPLPPVPPVGLPSALLDARPDVRASEAQLASANANIGVAKAALFPSISLTGAFGVQSQDLSDLFKGGGRIWSVGGLIDLPLFDAGRRSAQLDQATAVQKEAVEQYRKTAENAYREVRDALVGVTQNEETERQYERALTAARNAERIARARYEAGSAAFLELLDAQRSTNDAQVQFIRARQNRLSASVDLYKALGGGWKASFD